MNSILLETHTSNRIGRLKIHLMNLLGFYPVFGSSFIRNLLRRFFQIHEGQAPFIFSVKSKTNDTGSGFSFDPLYSDVKVPNAQLHTIPYSGDFGLVSLLPSKAMGKQLASYTNLHPADLTKYFSCALVVGSIFFGTNLACYSDDLSISLVGFIVQKNNPFSVFAI
jgi:hypothetical protein